MQSLITFQEMQDSPLMVIEARNGSNLKRLRSVCRCQRAAFPFPLAHETERGQNASTGIRRSEPASMCEYRFIGQPHNPTPYRTHLPCFIH